jgi:hypothetical protein
LLSKYGELAGTISTNADVNSEYLPMVQELTDALGF